MMAGASSDSASPYPVSRLAPPFQPTDETKQMQTVETALASSVSTKLQDIAAQIEALQNKAREVVEEALWAVEIHKAKCGTEKKVGQIYHLYRRPNGETYLSIMAPNEWGPRGPPHESLGSFKLEADMTWTRAEKVPTRENLAHMLKVLNLADPRLLAALTNTAPGGLHLSAIEHVEVVDSHAETSL